MLVSWNTVSNDRRRRVLNLLNSFCDNLSHSREIEASIHALCTDLDEYVSKSQQLIFNIRQNVYLVPKGKHLVFNSDQEMAEGTIIENIEQESQIQRMRFEQMLEEKYEMLNDKSFKSTLKCRRCGSSEVSWEQKQTRSADEAMTVFCTCNKCNQRWTMR